MTKGDGIHDTVTGHRKSTELRLSGSGSRVLQSKGTKVPDSFGYHSSSVWLADNVRLDRVEDVSREQTEELDVVLWMTES